MSFIRNITLSKAQQFCPIKENKKLFEVYPAGFLQGFLIKDKCLVHHFEPEAKSIHAVEAPHLTCTKVGLCLSSAAKIMASAYCNSNGVMFIDYIQKTHFLNGGYYIILLRQLWKAVKSQRPWNLVKDNLFHLDSATEYTSVVSMAASCDFGFELVDPTTDTSDLTFIYSPT